MEGEERREASTVQPALEGEERGESKRRRKAAKGLSEGARCFEAEGKACLRGRQALREVVSSEGYLQLVRKRGSREEEEERRKIPLCLEGEPRRGRVSVLSESCR